MNSHLYAIILNLLEQHPEGVSEYQLIECLKQQNPENYEWMKGDNLDIFRGHFILFHVLYKLRLFLWEQELHHLEIHTLKIKLMKWEQLGQGMVVVDPLQDYYLDLSQLEQTNAEDVEKMLDYFWVQFVHLDGREDALAVLELQDPVDDVSIKLQYRRLAMLHHPDRGGDQKKLQAINRAMDQLLR
jgi:hypothetical protein